MRLHNLTINPTALGNMALHAARHVWQHDMPYSDSIKAGPYEETQYEHLLALLEVCSIDYIAKTERERDAMLHKVLDIFDETDDLAAVGEYVAEWIDSFKIREA